MKILGFTFFALLIIGIGLDVILAIRNGEAFTGVNAYGLAIPVYPALAILLVAAFAGVVWVSRRIRSALRSRRSG